MQIEYRLSPVKLFLSTGMKRNFSKAIYYPTTLAAWHLNKSSFVRKGFQTDAFVHIYLPFTVTMRSVSNITASTALNTDFIFALLLYLHRIEKKENLKVTHSVDIRRWQIYYFIASRHYMMIV